MLEKMAATAGVVEAALTLVLVENTTRIKRKSSIMEGVDLVMEEVVEQEVELARELEKVAAA